MAQSHVLKYDRRRTRKVPINKWGYQVSNLRRARKVTCASQHVIPVICKRIQSCLLHGGFASSMLLLTTPQLHELQQRAQITAGLKEGSLLPIIIANKYLIVSPVLHRLTSNYNLLFGDRKTTNFPTANSIPELPKASFYLNMPERRTYRAAKNGSAGGTRLSVVHVATEVLRD